MNTHSLSIMSKVSAFPSTSCPHFTHQETESLKRKIACLRTQLASKLSVRTQVCLTAVTFCPKSLLPLPTLSTKSALTSNFKILILIMFGVEIFY